MGRLPNSLEMRMGTQRFIGCDQRPAAVERSGGDEAISRIPVLKDGAVSDVNQVDGLRQSG